MRTIALFLFATLFLPGGPKIQGGYEKPFAPGKNATLGILRIHQTKPSSYVFYLQVNGPGPAYNSGQLYGQLNYDAKKQAYQFLPTKAHGCKLSVTRSGKNIIVKTLAGNCGFGSGVVVDGIYQLRDPHDQDHFQTLSNAKVYFDKTPIDKFREN